MSIDEYKELIKKLDADMSKENILALIDMTPKVGFLNLVKDDEIREFLSGMQEKMGEVSADDLKEIIPPFMNVMFGGMKDLLNASEEAQEELEDMDDMSMCINVPEMNNLGESIT